MQQGTNIGRIEQFSSELLNETVQHLSNYATADFGDVQSVAHTFTDMHRTLEGIINERREKIETVARNTLDIEPNAKLHLSIFVRTLMEKNAELFKNKSLTETIKGVSQTIKGLTETINGLDTQYVQYEELVNNAAFVEDAYEKLNNELLSKCNDTATTTFKEQCLHLLTIYKTTTKKLITLEKNLKEKLLQFKDLQKNVEFLNSLGSNEESEALISAYNTYVKKAFDDSSMSDLYVEYMKTVAYWTLLRELYFIHSNLQMSEESRNPICTICVEDGVTLALIPCGHTFCASCRAQFGYNCPICRNRIRSVQTLYF